MAVLFVLIILLPSLARAQNSVPQAPPPAPPTVTRTLPRTQQSARAALNSTPALYSIGSPTDEEQYYLELINRARSNPPTEGARLATTTDPDVTSAINYFSVNLSVMQSEFNAIVAAPPLSMNAALTNAARSHSDWMFQNVIQSHYEGSVDPGARITAAGYTWTIYGENVYASAKSVFYGHAGFEIDWGGGPPDGMQLPRGHRENIHSTSFREVGIGMKLGTNTSGGSSVGPQLVTQDFATASGSTPFVTGVVYYDLNGNNFYDPGEGIGGVTVNVDGSSYYAVTASSGGYSVPVPNVNTTRAVTFSDLGFNATTNASISNLQNVKVDYSPVYTAPTVAGPAVAYVGSPNNAYSFNTVGGATQYGWRYATKSVAAAESCDSLTNVTTSTSSSYNVVDTGVKDSGSSASFHLAHPVASTQTVTLNGQYYPAAGASMQFRSRLGWASALQVARVQISTNGGTSWSDLYAQAGNDSSGESSFNTRTLSLAAYSGTVIRLRFSFTFSGGGSYYPQTSAGVGWYIDTISFSNTSQLAGITTVEPVASTAFNFSPPSTGTYMLSARPYISGRYWDYGPMKEVTAQAPMSYTTWISTQYQTVTGGPGADYDKDGLNNGIEFAFGLNPTVANAASAAPLPTIGVNSMTLACTQPAGVTGVTYGAQYSSDLVHWNDLLTDTGTAGTHTFTVNTVDQPRMFMRWKITVAP